MRVRLLFCDDRRSEREALSRVVEERLGDRVQLRLASSLPAVQALVDRGEPFDVVVSDMDFSVAGGGASDGLRVLALCREHWPQCELMVLTARVVAPDLVLEAGSRGVRPDAWLTKCADDPTEMWDAVVTALEQALERILRRRPAGAEAAVLAAVGRYTGRLAGVARDDWPDGVPRLIGRSAAWRDVLRQVEQVSATPATVLVTGETGTGKELVSEEIHARSGREPLVSLNCGALSEDLLASTLFGHARGAFTGADTARRGLLDEVADGTLFLDEVGELSLRNQAKLLRVLQTGEYRAIGSSTVRATAARLIAATNRDLEAMCDAGTFRRDLFDRLAVYRIHIPPLRERREDIPGAVVYHLGTLVEDVGRTLDHIDEAALWRLVDRDWPENMRELMNCLTRALIDMPDGERVLRARHLEPAEIHERTRSVAEELWDRIRGGELRLTLPELAKRFGRPAARDVVVCVMQHEAGLPSEELALRWFGMGCRQWRQWAHYHGLTWKKVRKMTPR